MKRGIFGKRLGIAGIAGLLVLSAAAPLGAATERSGKATTEISESLLESHIQETEASTTLNDATKAKLVELYRRALANLQKAQADAIEAQAFAAAQETAPAQAKKLRDQLARRPDIDPASSMPARPDAPLQALEQQLQQQKGELAALETKLSSLSKQLEFHAGRPSAVRERLIAARAQQQDLLADAKAPAPPGEAAAVTEARQWALKTQARALSAEVDKLDKELLSHQARLDLLDAQRDAAEQDVERATARVRALEDLLGKRRLVEAEQAQQETAVAQQELEGKHPLVRELAMKNAALGDALRERALALEKVAAEDERARKNAQRFGDELSTVKQKLDVAGLSQALGRVLMDQRRTLPDLASLARQDEKREQRIAEADLQQIQYHEERRRLRDMDEYVAEITRSLPTEEAEAIKPELHDLAATRLELLDKVIATQASYLRSLGELDLAQRQLNAVIQDYDAFLGKRLLWIRSTDPIGIEILQTLPHEVARLLSPAAWYAVAEQLGSALISNPLAIVAVIVLTFLSFRRRHFLRAVVATSDNIRRVRTDRFTYTWQALAFTVLAAAPVPLLLLTLGWQLLSAHDINEFSRAVGMGLMRVARDFLVLQFFADVAIANGLVVKHFRWPADAAAKLRRELRLLMLLFLPAVFLVFHGLVLDRSGVGGGLTLLAVLFAIGAIGVFVLRTFTPQGGILAEFLARRPDSLLARLRPIWLGALMAAIFSLLALVLAGYLYTGGTLTRNLLFTIWFVYVLILARGLVVRWLLLVHRRLAVKAALERREEARAAREAARKETGSSTGGDDTPPEVEEPEVDLAALDAQSRKLLNTAILFAGVIGMWLIWSPVLPAFGVLEDVSLWTRTDTASGIDALTPVTLADLALALIVAIVTVVAARGLPAFVEFMLLQRTAITAGARFTATTLLRYVIVGVGLVAFFNILGADWSQIQWLVAALGVGIGFGLQEIVANFISGLIILFERPIRVGDIVTVGNTSGVVSRINIRATTITNWDRQELLVPNKEFITQQLLNWSLTDPITRVSIPVGIAYGSDVTLALKLMQESAEENSNVLKDPAPVLTFDGFGDNTLNLTLRVYLPSIENRLRTVTEINHAINRKFNEAGVVIAFPQRDVHLDTSGPIDVRLHRVTGDKRGDD
jgi:potassium efflux system protein